MTAVLSLKPVKLLVGRIRRAPQMPTHSTTIRVEENPAASVLHVHGRLTIEQVGAFYDSVEEAVRGDAPRLVINLTACPFIDSAGIAALVTALNRARKAHKEFFLAGLNSQVISALEMARLHMVFSVCATLTEALADPATRERKSGE